MALEDFQVDDPGDGGEQAELDAIHSVTGADFDPEDDGGDITDAAGETQDDPAPRAARRARQKEEPAAEDGPSDHQRQANERFKARQEARRTDVQRQSFEVQRVQEESAKYRNLSNSLLQILQRQRTAEAQSPEDLGDPELAAALARERQQLRRELGEELRPVREEAQRVAQDRERSEREAAQQEQQGRAMNEFVGTIHEAEVEYRGTPDGQGYDQRVDGYKDTVRGMFSRLGITSQNLVEGLIREDLKGIAMMAHALQVSPAVAMDVVARTFLGGQVAGRPAPSRRRSSPEVQIAREATMAGATHRAQRGNVASRRSSAVTAEQVLERGLTEPELERMFSSGNFANQIAALALQAEGLDED